MLIPPYVRFWMGDTQTDLKFLVEQPPRIIDLKYSRFEAVFPYKRLGPPTIYRVAVPWTYALIHITSPVWYRDSPEWKKNSLFLFWSKDRLKRLSDPVIGARLPNFRTAQGYGPTSEGHGCFHPNGAYAKDSSLFVETIVNQIDDIPFNPELGENRPLKYPSFEAWEADSAEIPLTEIFSTWKDFDMLIKQMPTLEDRFWSSLNWTGFIPPNRNLGKIPPKKT